jgi:hypothetical protein
MAFEIMVPKRGLEPPHPDGYYTLNVARLPIPPLRHIELTALVYNDSCIPLNPCSVHLENSGASFCWKPEIQVRKMMIAGVPTGVYCPVKVRLPVSRLIRNAVIASLL